MAAAVETPLKVEMTEHLWITLRDGCRLAARLWLPEGAHRTPVPAILEYIPYRKRDGTRARDEPMHGYFAGHGYAVLRVDMRGSGESDGLMWDEYLKQEQDDALEVIAWMAAQPWCNGHVGMMGKSWGGFNCLQVAALRPPALKAVLSVCSTDDRYVDDIHYMGGCLLNDNLWWGTIMLVYQARPADPELFGESWRDNWRERLEQMPFWPALAMAHQRRDDYWRHGSICEDWNAIQVPVCLIGGWVDAYTNTVPRMLEHLKVPRKGIIGPWAHVYPHDGTPGPAIGFLQDAIAWWDRWLNGIENGADEEPMLRAWLQDYTAPETTRSHHPGRWVAEQSWPSPEFHPCYLHLNKDGLAPVSGAEEVLALRSPQHVGLQGGEWMAAGCVGELPGDQRIDDFGSLTFDTAPLEEAMQVVGAPELELKLTSDKPVAQLCARLCDVAPDGEALRVSFQVINLTHRDSHAEPTPLEPGKRYKVKLVLNACAHRFAAGHRLRISLSSAYWPLIWPAPERATLGIITGASRLMLPHRRPQAADGGEPFLKAEAARATSITQVNAGSVTRSVTFDITSGEVTTVTDTVGVFGEGRQRLDEIGTEVLHQLRRELRIAPDDPLHASFTCRQTYVQSRPGWDIRIEVTTRLHADRDHFYISGELDAFEDDIRFASREWREKIKRDLI
ncbi:CocE/NonD family hydrolase [Sorangium sp. So ce117]|uniref:CocE/NonD family hydrolase n=1 Tax=Sorangium sp. So ce117 TaxID=3133277 RepID=UPI003F6477D3